MFKNVKNIHPLLCASTVSIVDVLLEENDKTGLERLHQSFSIRNWGNSKEIKFITQSVSNVYVVSCFLGAAIYSKEALETFQKDIYKYKMFYEFKVEREAYTFGKLARGIVVFSSIGGALSFVCCTLLAVANSYRGKPGIIEYATSGALCGSSLAWYFINPIAAVYGGIVGFAVGTACGAALIAYVRYEKVRRQRLSWMNKNIKT